MKIKRYAKRPGEDTRSSDLRRIGGHAFHLTSMILGNSHLNVGIKSASGFNPTLNLTEEKPLTHELNGFFDRLYRKLTDLISTDVDKCLPRLEFVFQQLQTSFRLSSQE